jgi:hypothetical protein
MSQATLARHIARWLALRDDLPALAVELARVGWSHPQLSPDQTQLTITGPSGTRITLWQGLEPFTCETQLRLGWLGVLGFSSWSKGSP